MTVAPFVASSLVAVSSAPVCGRGQGKARARERTRTARGDRHAVGVISSALVCGRGRGEGKCEREVSGTVTRERKGRRADEDEGE